MGRFRTTHWSVVLATREHDAAARTALATLLADYRAPVCAFIRQAGHRERDVEDLAQAFFVRFIEMRWHDDADPDRGRFRTFLLVALKRFLANEHDGATALKRGGAVTFTRIDTGVVETLSADTDDTPEQAFDRAFARATIAAALADLEREADANDRGAVFRALRPYLVDAPEGDDYARLATQLGIKRNTLAVLVKRLRARLDALVRERVESQVASPADVAGEIDRLRAVIARRGSLNP